MEEPQNSAHAEKNLVVFFTDILAAIKLPFLLKKSSTSAVVGHPAPAVAAAAPKAEEEPIKIKPPVVPDESDRLAIVTLPKQRLKLEPDAEEKEQSANPLLPWQVYAIGGFFVLRWAWKRWNEHKGGKKSDDEPCPPASD